MFRVFLFCILIFIFSGCFSEVKSPSKIKTSEKAFEQEDNLILLALRAEELKDYNSSASIFNTLYEKSNKEEYLYRSIQNDLYAQKFEHVLKKIGKISNKDRKDYMLIRMKIIALVGLCRYEEAKSLAIDLVDDTHKVKDYIVVSEIYVKQKKFNTAVKYLESAYAQNYNEKILDKISIVLYVNLQRKKDAIAQLETHLRVYGCSRLICLRLVGFYSDENNIDGLLSIYLRLYNAKANDKIAKKIVQIYVYKKDYFRLLGFLKKSKSDDKLLLELYINIKDYKNASPLAYEMYKKTGDINYLGQSAIFEYESSKNKFNKNMQKKVIEKLKKVLKVKEDPLYLNYLGYLLIDHAIDVKEGVKYIKRALKVEPNSLYYLDSLAWGYYKLGNCKKAKIIMKKVMKIDGDNDNEVLTHINAINKCLKHKKRKGKKRK